MSNIQESMFQAMEIIADKKLEGIKFDKTIECIISVDTLGDKGEYEATYQDIIIKVFSNNNTVRYRKGDGVYVLVPQGNFSNKKTIVGKVEQKGEEFLSVENILDRIEVLDYNYVDEPVGHSFEVNANTLKKEIKFKKEKFVNEYGGKLNLLIAGTIKSHLPKTKGKFGIKLDLTYEGDIRHEFDLNMDNMVGNPYSLDNNYQYKVFSLFNKKVKQVNGMYVYMEGFDPAGTGFEGDRKIIFTNLEVSFANPKEVEGLDSFSARMKAEKGTVFKNGILDKHLKEEERATLTLEMIPEKQGKPIKPNAVYKWFYADSRVVGESSLGWDIDGGEGWYYINPPKEQKANQKDGMSFDKNEKVLVLTPEAVPNLETFKCVAIFGGETLDLGKGETQTVGVIKVEAYETITDQTDPVNIVILSSKGDVFKAEDNIESTELTCEVFVGLEKYDSKFFTYNWSRAEKDGRLTLVQSGDSASLTISNINGIINTESYICEVYVKE